MTTPRVTVPVDYETLSELHTLKGWLHGLANRPDLCDVVADSGVTSGMVYQQEATEFAGRLRRILDGSISAAPAPEGGAVLAKRVSPGEAINRAVGDEVLTAKALESITTAGWVFAHKDDISTREVAPAEAGALVSQIDALLAIPEANLSSRIPYLARELLERSAKHLRAQPQAREDAQPVAWVVRKGLSTGSLFYTERGQNADLPDGTLLYTTPPAPEAEKLRVAVEALEPFAAVMADIGESEDDADSFRNPRRDYAKSQGISVGHIRRASQALAALQAEQKGGA